MFCAYIFCCLFVCPSFVTPDMVMCILHLGRQEEGVRVLKAEDRVTAPEFRHIVQSSSIGASETSSGRPYLLIDVRPELETSICRLPDSVNLPYESLNQRTDELKELLGRHLPPNNDTLSGMPHCHNHRHLPVLATTNDGQSC